MMRRKTQKTAYTLVEILIIVGLLGLIAAFAVPKVIQAQSTQHAAARLKETVASLESAWSELKTHNSFVEGLPLYNSLEGAFNDSQHSDGPASELLDNTHPCADFEGYIQLVNGVVIAGLVGDGIRESVFPETNPPPSNYLLCIDINGPDGPNTAGNDVFGGNFNQSGNFDGAGEDFTYEEDNENFYWGGKRVADCLYASGHPGLKISEDELFGPPESRVGNYLY